MGLLDDLHSPQLVCAFHQMLQRLPDEERQAVLDYVEQIRARTNIHDGYSPSVAKLYNVLKNNGQKVGKNQISAYVNKTCTCSITS